MAISKFAIIDKNNIVVNVIVWDEVSEWEPPTGTTLVKIKDTDPVSRFCAFDPKRKTFSYPTELSEIADSVSAVDAGTLSKHEFDKKLVEVLRLLNELPAKDIDAIEAAVAAAAVDIV